MPVLADDVRFHRQRRVLLVPEVAFEDEALGDGAGLRLVSGQRLGRERVERERRREDEQPGEDRPRNAG
jgi:hypothetical protein